MKTRSTARCEIRLPGIARNASIRTTRRGWWASLPIGPKAPSRINRSTDQPNNRTRQSAVIRGKRQLLPHSGFWRLRGTKRGHAAHSSRDGARLPTMWSSRRGRWSGPASGSSRSPAPRRLFIVADPQAWRHQGERVSRRGWPASTTPCSSCRRAKKTSASTRSNRSPSGCTRPAPTVAAACVAFGGGIAGDVGGFVAASYMRGVDVIQVPDDACWRRSTRLDRRQDRRQSGARARTWWAPFTSRGWC